MGSVGGEREEQTGLLHRIGSFGARVGKQPPRKRSTKLIMQVGVPLLIFLALGYVVLRQWSSLPDYEWHFSPGWLVLSIAAAFTYYMVAASVWLGIVRLMDEKLSFAAAQSIFAKSLLARYVPGNMLLVITRVVMSEREGVSRKTALTSVVYELAIAMCAAIAIASYFIVTLDALEGSPVRWLMLASVPLMLAFLHPRVFQPATDWVLNKFGREPLPAVLGFRQVILVLAGYVVAWAVMGISAYAFVRSVFVLDIAEYLTVTAAFTLAWTFAVVTFISPSGLGTRDAAYALGLKVVMPGAAAAAVAIGTRILLTAVELVYVAIVMGIARSLRTRNKEAPEGAPDGDGTGS